MSDIQQQYEQATVSTVQDLRTIAKTVSKLSLPEIENLVGLIGRLVPAGNVPGVVLNGLARLKGRPLPENTRRDIDALFTGVERFLDRAVFLGVFAGPAMVIYAYQKMITLLGRNPDEFFPEGTWQYYVDYALREDTARHANETHGFDTTLSQHEIHLDQIDRMTAWVMAGIHVLHQYDRLLENEWRERVYTYHLRDEYPTLYQEWERKRPYARGHDVSQIDDYATYRRYKFDRFMADATKKLAAEKRYSWEEKIQAAIAEELPAYQKQMSILAYLEPGYYHETRTRIALQKAHVGVIYQGQYYLIPICRENAPLPADVNTVRWQVSSILYRPAEHEKANLTALAQLKRANLSKPGLSIEKALNTLKLTPILINFDQRPSDLPLAEIRQAERGVGSHALTLFDTGETMVFDLSHIFFDGAFGAALAEIFTNEALSWAVYLNSLPPGVADGQRPYTPKLTLNDHDLKQIEKGDKVAIEVSAETDRINFKSILKLRNLFKKRSDLLQLTVNDLLILYRGIHAATYKPSPLLIKKLHKIADKEAEQVAIHALKENVSPATLIPVDASPRSPRDRVYPMSFEVPLKELKLLNLHKQAIAALEAYESDRKNAQKFDDAQRHYLAILAAFGEMMNQAKQIALSGESASVGSIKMLAHMPRPLQKVLDGIPGYFDVLNDIIKGREVFSNVGAVVPSSTLTRFITAKDDNEKKTLAWSVITDADGMMRLALRDFRPHVRKLIEAGERELAVEMVDDYLKIYAEGFNRYIAELYRITAASRETQEKLYD